MFDKKQESKSKYGLVCPLPSRCCESSFSKEDDNDNDRGDVKDNQCPAVEDSFGRPDPDFARVVFIKNENEDEEGLRANKICLLSPP